MSLVQLANAVDAVFDEDCQRTERQKASIRGSIEAALEFYELKPVEYDRILSTLRFKSLGELEEILELVMKTLEPPAIALPELSSVSNRTAELCGDCKKRNSSFAALD